MAESLYFYSFAFFVSLPVTAIGQWYRIVDLGTLEQNEFIVDKRESIGRSRDVWDNLAWS